MCFIWNNLCGVHANTSKYKCSPVWTPLVCKQVYSANRSLFLWTTSKVSGLSQHAIDDGDVNDPMWMHFFFILPHTQPNKITPEKWFQSCYSIINLWFSDLNHLFWVFTEKLNCWSVTNIPSMSKFLNKRIILSSVEVVYCLTISVQFWGKEMFITEGQISLFK